MKPNDIGAVIIESIYRARPALRSMPSKEMLSIKISELALDSLDSTTLSLDIEDFCGVIIEPLDFFDCETLRDLQTIVFERL
jgi:acyl carrier protein